MADANTTISFDNSVWSAMADTEVHAEDGRTYTKIWDSGATAHISPYQWMFDSFEEHTETIHIADNSTIQNVFTAPSSILYERYWPKAAYHPFCGAKLTITPSTSTTTPHKAFSNSEHPLKPIMVYDQTAPSYNPGELVYLSKWTQLASLPLVQKKNAMLVMQLSKMTNSSRLTSNPLSYMAVWNLEKMCTLCHSKE
ncbi:hypothetical protein PHLCEN_2v9955 [Hermanssonia centrifuga]|uniref:Uncharacterized protein n=1 Tax=Hermanssonia centrifuga TaxID=98765 RepID=A0A2R6NPC2_9APHY|nr:hypothetical protein PHLCEN_2v9955 [Hermanssonia centrifuga]